MNPIANIDEIVENFGYLDEWDDRYRYLIELGRGLAPLDQSAYCEANKVVGCASQVWLDTRVEPREHGEPVLTFRADSDAHIVRGLLALILALYSGHTPAQILSTDAQTLFQDLGLTAHLTRQRTNGVRAMVERIQSEARRAAAEARVA